MSGEDVEGLVRCAVPDHDARESVCLKCHQAEVELRRGELYAVMADAVDVAMELEQSRAEAAQLRRTLADAAAEIVSLSKQLEESRAALRLVGVSRERH